jgi:serine/threonine protein kinase
MNVTDILHGDLKPANVVITNDAQGRPKAQLIDFGYSCFGSTDDDLVWLPFSPPWTAPEHEWKEYSLSAGKRMDVHSLGMTVAYLIFQSRWQRISQRVGGEGAGSSTDGTEDAADASHLEPCKRMSVVDIIEVVVQGTDVDLSMIPPGISKFLQLTLATEPLDRETDLGVLATLLGETSINRHGSPSPS